MTDHDITIPTKRKDLSLAELGQLVPGPGILMPDIARRAWVAHHAAQNGNWKLAAYMLRQLTHRLTMIQVSRPNLDESIQQFTDGPLARLVAAVTAADLTAFDAAMDAVVIATNAYHVKHNHPEIVWRVPSTPPEEFELTP